MASSAPTSATGRAQNPIGRRNPIKFFALTCILLLSFRFLSQKYHIHNLTKDGSALKVDQEGLIAHMNHIKRCILAEGALKSTGAFAARHRLLLGDESS
ncbi:Unknown protein [Striga hermonthica]|uniref:Uncharacterized protein n=1 Tax=Striga hermonthica TaxID=68872 RepID=A0A9N7R2I5_STRHE|nr:Unknown protein [Striga hermonthica]